MLTILLFKIFKKNSHTSLDKLKEINKKIMCKENRGITLIALVITIIVLLILAGVTIAALSGNNGILTRAKEAKEKTEQAQKDEEKTLSNMESILGIYNFKNINVADTNPGEVVPENSMVLEDDANKGIVIKDKNNNEWVWVEVPKTTVFSDLTIDTTGTLTEQNYIDIKNKLITYATTYREGKSGQGCDWTDEWYNGCGMTSDEYTTAYQKMLKSAYTYGGFWIGRYEAGIEGSIEDVSRVRTEHTDITIGKSLKAVSQKDAIPYNYVYCSEAQALANEMSPDGNCVSSLMFGIQWDLVCKFLEMKSDLMKADINLDSNTWGIYTNVERKITSDKAKQQGIPWMAITGTKPAQSILLSVGASDETKKMNIYDFAGNEWEWTLEHATSWSDNSCANRGGNYNSESSYSPASYRNSNEITSSYYSVGFRSTFYLK